MKIGPKFRSKGKTITAGSMVTLGCSSGSSFFQPRILREREIIEPLAGRFDVEAYCTGSKIPIGCERFVHQPVTTGVSLVGGWDDPVIHDAVNGDKRVICGYRSDIRALEGHQPRPINSVLLQRYISDHRATRVLG